MLCVHIQVLREDASQEDTYKAVVQGTIQDTLQGVNATVLAYGQTGALFALRHEQSLPVYARIPFRYTSALPGSGKTHSLFGDLSSEGLEGIVPRAVHELTDMLFHTDNGIHSCMGCQVMCMSIVFIHALASKGMIACLNC